MEDSQFTLKQRASSRILNLEKRKEYNSRRHKVEIGRLDAEAFANRTKYLRELFLDPETRHTYEWTALEKKILALDWYRNPEEYSDWCPAETEDMSTSLFSNLIFNYSHLAMVNIGSTVILCKLLNEFVNIGENYQIICMVVRSEIGEQEVEDSLRVGLIRRGEQKAETFGDKKVMLYSVPKPVDFQCICDGISFNIHSYSDEEFNLEKPCDLCDHRKIHLRTQLYLPEVCFKSHVVGLHVTSAIVESRRNYLAAVKKVDGSVHIVDITRMIQVTLEVIHKWIQKHAAFTEKVKELYRTLKEEAPKAAKEESDVPVADSETTKRCTGCLVTDDDLRELEAVRQMSVDFVLPFQPVKCFGLDVTSKAYRGVPIRRISQDTSIRFVYTSLENIGVVIPIYVVAVGGTKVCVWSVGNISEGGTREPIMEMKFPEDVRPTAVTATLGIGKDYTSVVAGKFIHEPLFYTTDDAGYLRLWTLSSNKCDATIRIDTNSLLSVDVNMKYPNLLVIGAETGKIKVYNIWKQCLGFRGKPPGIDFVRMATIPSYLPNVVYEHLRWYHPVVKVRWVNHTMVMAQYAEPLFSRESTNASTVAIWNIAKDIFDRDDAILCHRTFSQDMSNSWHLASRLVCLYGGHVSSLSGVISSDCLWSSDQGLVAISSDAIGQLHIYKPGIWTWADYDDGLCLARFKGDKDFHSRLLQRVKQEYKTLMNRQPTDSRDSMASSDLRKHRARFGDFVQDAHSQVETLKEEKMLKNDFASLPNWIRRTLKLNSDGEKLLKQIRNNLREREIKEHTLSSTAVQR
ncbi:hypothetical protein BgAZ_103820 [Babesia gibsoni]|uniref:Uncharacterized protein n=1 Tax=Babesia gibsoni TaxID=33632 RepID=A0AAD8UT32_BABGI|nr:hypothetical protein BgAZ_103820 [Babesia gibsoni]